jgi:dipeptidyl aminopeptidase/acylaminoacyl peptidase
MSARIVLTITLLLALLRPAPAEEETGPAASGPETLGELSVPAAENHLTARFSPDGRWLVLSEGHRMDEGRGEWTWTGFRLVDLSSGKEAWQVRRPALGRNLPVFSRDSRHVAYGDATDPDSLRVVVRRLADGERRRHDVPRIWRHEGFAVVAAIDPTVQRAAIVFPADRRRRRRLVVRDLAEGRDLLRLENFQEPYHGSSRFEVAFVGDGLLYHFRPPEGASGGSYCLRLVEIPGGRARATLGTWVSKDTPRYRLSGDGRRLYNGDSAYAIQEVDVATGEVRELAGCHETLYSHWLELSLSPDEKTLIAWSGSRRTLVRIDLASGARRDVEPPRPWARVLGFDPGGRVILAGERGVAAHDLRTGKEVDRLLDHRPEWVELDPTGRVLVAAEKARGEWRVRLLRLAE